MDHPAVSIPSVNDALEFAYTINNAGEDSFSPNKDDRRGPVVHPILVSEMIFSKGTSTNELNKAIIVKDLEFGASDILFEGGIFNGGFLIVATEHRTRQFFTIQFQFQRQFAGLIVGCNGPFPGSRWIWLICCNGDAHQAEHEDAVCQELTLSHEGSPRLSGSRIDWPKWPQG